MPDYKAKFQEAFGSHHSMCRLLALSGPLEKQTRARVQDLLEFVIVKINTKEDQVWKPNT